MNTSFVLQISKAAKVLKCRRLIRSLLLLLPLPYKRHFRSIEEAEKYINSLYPDVDNSCVCKNHVRRPPLFDLVVIIPVYNTAPFVARCLQSVLSQQTQYRFAVIAVNDGSTDGSRSILKNYEDDERVTIIDQENQGLSGARNAALHNITAKYLTFIDSDDFLAEGAIENLMRVAINEKADIVEGSFAHFTKKWKKRVIQKRGLVSGSDLYGFAWGKVIKAGLFEQTRFPLGYWYEDTLMRLVLFRLAKKTIGINDVVYYHNKSNSNSITHKAKGKYKNLDSFYITRRLLKDERLLNIEMTEELFLSLIEKQIPINTIRISSVPDSKMNDAHFMLTCAMVEDVWGQKDFVSNSEKANSIYRAIKDKDYNRFICHCLF